MRNIREILRLEHVLGFVLSSTQHDWMDFLNLNHLLTQILANNVIDERPRLAASSDVFARGLLKFKKSSQDA